MGKLTDTLKKIVDNLLKLICFILFGVDEVKNFFYRREIQFDGVGDENLKVYLLKIFTNDL